MWSVPPMWKGQTVAILASGPSMSQAVADSLRSVPCIAINNTYRLAPLAAMLYAADSAWWMHPQNRDAREFEGLKVSVGQVPGVHQLRNSGVVGFDPDPTAVRTGGNSAYQAVHIAAHAGASRILLAGVDMKGGHWHPEHPAPLLQTCEVALARWIERFEGLAKLFAERGGPEVMNVTPGSALKCFPAMSVDDALRSFASA